MSQQKPRSASPGRQLLAAGQSTAVTDGRRVKGLKQIKTNSNYCETLEHCSELNASWERLETSGTAPDPSEGQSIVYCDRTNKLLCAYGRNPDETFNDKFWEFSLQTKVWTFFKIPGAQPRAGCGCAQDGDRIWFFGGMSGDSFERALHYISLSEHTITFPKTTGPPPPPCANPLVCIYENQLFVWAGTGGSNPSSLHVLDTQTLTWKEIPTDIVYRSGSIGAIIGTTLYVFGCSVSMTMVAVDLISHEITLLPTEGNEPTNFDDLVMVSIRGAFIAVETAADHCYMYVFNYKRSTWHQYNVPLCSGVTPEQNPITIFYQKQERRLVAVWESVEFGSQPMTTLCVGCPLSDLHQKMDLLDMIVK